DRRRRDDRRTEIRRPRRRRARRFRGRTHADRTLERRAQHYAHAASRRGDARSALGGLAERAREPPPLLRRRGTSDAAGGLAIWQFADPQQAFDARIVLFKRPSHYV